MAIDKFSKFAQEVQVRILIAFLLTLDCFQITTDTAKFLVYYCLRPGAEEFLSDLSKLYNICLCTTAEMNVTLSFTPGIFN